jgi:hypothetical protein
MSSSIFLPEFPLPANALKLGWLTLNAEYPYQDISKSKLVAEEDVIIMRKENLFKLQEQSKDKGFQLAVTRILKAYYQKSDASTEQLRSPIATTYLLQNSGKWFGDLCKTEETQHFIESAIRQSRSIYLISGYHTLLDAQSDSGISAGRTVGGTATVPVGDIVAGAAGVLPGALGDTLDVSFGFGSSGNNRSREHFLAPGEQIFAVQYRKVRFNFFSTKQVENATLEGNHRWRGHWRKTTGGGDMSDESNGELDEDEKPSDVEAGGDDEDDGLEVSLADDVELEKATSDLTTVVASKELTLN